MVVSQQETPNCTAELVGTTQQYQICTQMLSFNMGKWLQATETQERSLPVSNPTPFATIYEERIVTFKCQVPRFWWSTEEMEQVPKALTRKRQHTESVLKHILHIRHIPPETPNIHISE